VSANKIGVANNLTLFVLCIEALFSSNTNAFFLIKQCQHRNTASMFLDNLRCQLLRVYQSFVTITGLIFFSKFISLIHTLCVEICVTIEGPVL